MVEMHFPEIVIPLSVAPSMYSLVSNSKLSRIDRNASVWSVPCDSQFTLEVTVGGISFTMTEDVLVTQNGNDCESAIRSWINPSMTTYVLGSTFMQKAYIVFSAHRSGIANSKIGFAKRPTPSTHSKNVATIVGAVVGGVVGLLLLIGAAIAFVKWRRSKRDPASAQFNREVLNSTITTPGTMAEAGAQNWNPFDPRQASQYTPPQSRRESQAPPFVQTDSYTSPPQTLPTNPGYANGQHQHRISQTSMTNPGLGHPAPTSPRGVNMWVTPADPTA